MKLFHRRARKARRGLALVSALVGVVVLASMAGVLMTIEVARQGEVEGERAAVRSLYLAEAGVSECLLELMTAQNTLGSPDMALGDSQKPMKLHGGNYWADIDTDGSGLYRIYATGEFGASERTIEVVALGQAGGIYDNAIFAGNSSGDPTYTMPFGGTGSQGDEIYGDVYSAGDIDVTGDAAIAGSASAKGMIYGMAGEVGVTQPVPDLAGQNYSVNNDVDVAAEFAAQKSYKWNGAGGKGYQVPETSPAHIFRLNPSDRAKEYKSTAKPDYFLEDPYEKIRVDKNQNGKDATHLTLTDNNGVDGGKWSNKVYYVDGNLWLHNKRTYSFKFYSSQAASTRVTFVVKGNIYFSDNLFYQNKNKDGIAFIAMKDENVQDSGNIYFGDPVFGTLKEMNAFMYAENDFLDYSLDASGSSQVTVRGNMTAGNQVDIQRDYQGKHSKLIVEFDDRVSSGDLAMPGLPETDANGSGGLQVVSWREVPSKYLAWVKGTNQGGGTSGPPAYDPGGPGNGGGKY